MRWAAARVWACADVAIAARDAVFGFSEAKLGIIPAVISPFVLPKIGAHARRYFLTGERFDAETALRIGLIERSPTISMPPSTACSPSCCRRGLRRCAKRSV